MPDAIEQPYLGFAPDISEQDWKFVDELIQDLEEEERQEQFVAALFLWKYAIRKFRAVEFRRMRHEEPAPKDLRYHSLSLAALIAVGEALAMNIGEMDNREGIEQQGIRREDVEAALSALKRNWVEWHGQNAPERVDALRARIFNA